MNVVDAINALEIVWWIGCGALVLTKSLRANHPHRQRGLLAAITLILFGLSDAVELQTGAWWKPWWLLLWKATCVVVLIGCVMLTCVTFTQRTTEVTSE